MATNDPHRALIATSSRLPAGVLLFDSECGVTGSDQAWTQVTGLSRAQTAGDGWLSAVAPPSRAIALAQLEQAARGSASLATEWEVTRGARRRRVDTVAQPVPSAMGTSHRCIVAIVDITGQSVRDDQLVHDATHDALSGLLNRAAFDRLVEHALARLTRQRSTLALLFIDLDGFKSVNDRFGHNVGDGVLIAATNRLASIVRPSDTLARVGGDEFVVLCEDIHDAADVLTIGRRVIDAAERPFDIGDERIELGASVGITFTDDPATPASVLLQRADRAMYKAKHRGGGGLALHDDVAPVPQHELRPTAPRSASDEEDALPFATRVEVRERFRGGWTSGFDVAGITPHGYRLRRTSDRHQLPGEFASNAVRRAQ